MFKGCFRLTRNWFFISVCHLSIQKVKEILPMKNTLLMRGYDFVLRKARHEIVPSSFVGRRLTESSKGRHHRKACTRKACHWKACHRRRACTAERHATERPQPPKGMRHRKAYHRKAWFQWTIVTKTSNSQNIYQKKIRHMLQYTQNALISHQKSVWLETFKYDELLMI